jgi:hypothetical protein
MLKRIPGKPIIAQDLVCKGYFAKDRRIDSCARRSEAVSRVSKNAKNFKKRLPCACRSPEGVDYIDPTALDPGLIVTPE